MAAAPYQQPTSLEEVRTLWIGDLQYWADENYLYGCFAHTGEVQSVKIIRNKLTGIPEGYGFIEFISHEAAEKVLQTYNGTQMPGTEHTFRLNWASFSSGERRPDAGPDHSIFVGDLAPDVTDYLLQETFRANYPSVRGAKVVTDPNTGRSKGYGFVKFADENEKNRAMSEMNGVYCSTRPMRISAAIPKKTTGSQLQYSAAKAMYPATAYAVPQLQPVLPDSDLTNTTIFIGNLDPNVTEDELKQICVQFGELIYVKIPVGKGCGFVQYSSRASAEEAVQRLHGTVIGQQVVRLSWGRSPASKQDQSAVWSQQADPNQWASAYYGYGYDAYGYAQDPSYAYGAYAGYSQYPQQVEGATDMASAAGSHVPVMEQKEVYDPMNIPDVDQLNASYIAVHGRAMLGRPLWLKTSSLDCRHPKTAEDFLKLNPSPKGKLLRSMSAMLPFAERDTNLRDGNNNLKRRGAGIATFTSPKPKAAPKKRLQDDSENQDPALATPPPPPAASRPPFGAPRWAKNAKEAIKSSAEKRPDNAEKEALLSKNAAPRQLKSTLSARNLFSGKDILGQISEFYNELKRMVGGSGSRPVSETMEELSPSPMNGSDAVEKVACDSGTSVRVPLEAVREVARQETVETSPSPMKGKKMGLKVEAGKQRSPNVLKEVKATPPTPQRFPSPSVNRVKNVKAGGMATAGSPLKKPLKEKGTPNKDLENSRDAKRQPFGVKDMNNTRVCDAEGSSSSMFWFLKPCTFLVE